MREKGFQDVDSYTIKPDQRRLLAVDYQNEQQVLQTTPAGQAVQNVTHHKAQTRKYGAARVMNYLRWLLVALEILFLLRFCLMLLGVTPTSPFAACVYTLSRFFLSPFEGSRPLVSNLEFGPGGTHSLEWATLLAICLYALLFYLFKRLLRITILGPKQPFQLTEKREIHAVEEREQSINLSMGNPARQISLQNRDNTTHTQSPNLPMTNAPQQMDGGEIHTDSIALPITGKREREASLVKHHVGEYALIRQLGQGGYASVYLGKHDYLKTRVALKLLDPILASDEVVKHFLFEARTLAHLRHLHVVRMLDFGWEEDLPFIVMEYAPGGTLYDYFPPHLSLIVRTILPFVLQLASALQYVHDHGLIHCDVKPENILLGPNKEVWLSDFGTAQSTRAASSKQPSPSELVGTPMYVAPERLLGNPLPASDQYALALMVYHWLCGRGPFQGTILQVCLQHLDAPPPPLRDLVPSISRSVERVVLKALAKDPKQRFAHVQEFANALKQASQEERDNAFLKSLM